MMHWTESSGTPAAKSYGIEIFGKRSQEISVTFAPVPRLSEFLVKWKAPLVTEKENVRIHAHIFFCLIYFDSLIRKIIERRGYQKHNHNMKIQFSKYFLLKTLPTPRIQLNTYFKFRYTVENLKLVQSPLQEFFLSLFDLLQHYLQIMTEIGKSPGNEVSISWFCNINSLRNNLTDAQRRKGVWPIFLPNPTTSYRRQAKVRETNDSRKPFLWLVQALPTNDARECYLQSRTSKWTEKSGVKLHCSTKRERNHLGNVTSGKIHVIWLTSTTKQKQPKNAHGAWSFEDALMKATFILRRYLLETFCADNPLCFLITPVSRSNPVTVLEFFQVSFLGCSNG